MRQITHMGLGALNHRAVVDDQRIQLVGKARNFRRILAFHTGGTPFPHVRDLIGEREERPKA